MWELDYKESWALKNWCFWTVVLEKTLESPLDCKEIKPIHPKGDQSWIFIRRTDAEAETLILWLPDAKNWVIGKDPDAGKDWRQEEKVMRCSFPGGNWILIISSFSHSVMSNSLQPHGLQHTRLPCPSLSPGVCSNSCHWVGDAIQPSHPLSSPSPTFNLSQH